MSYPDRWTGPAAFQSDIYPDHWTADRMRKTKGVSQAYRDGIRMPSVPAFVVSAKQLINNLDSTTRAPHSTHTPATGTNNVALGSRASKKRNADIIDLVSSSPKRAKTEPPAPATVIDLTQDDDATTKFVPTDTTRRISSRPALTDITNGGAGLKPSQHRKRRKKSARFPREQNIHAESLGTLAKIASKLRASAHALEMDREALRQRWEVDEELQLHHVTENLTELNEYFTATENGIHAALEVIETRLL